jgi:hypothetical protein
MSITKLYLFTKDTDASATEQGFHYQKLKTLKTWLENRVNEVDDIIYCDYEEDIFERNIEEGKSKFRQVKLYSSNFSFSREEIQKSLAHFFMLFVKGDYLFDEVSFLFETNTGIAREMRGNDADLLKEWWQNQDAISNDLVTRCRIRVKAIVDEYITESYEKQMSAEIKGELQQAKSIYHQLENETWDKFIRSIKWLFDNIEQQEAIPKLLSEIEELVGMLPLPINIERVSTYVSILHYEIAQRTAQPKPANKILSNELMDFLLFKEGSETDQWYSNIYQKWHEVTSIKGFNVGAFYEVVNAARHCRWEVSSEKHRSVWLKLLKLYIDHHDTITVCKRKCIYEYLFLLTSPDPGTFKPKGTITGQQELVCYYFSEFDHRNSTADIEEDITLLEIIQTHQLLDEQVFKQGFLQNDEILEWSKRIDDTISDLISNSTNGDQLCLAYELKGNYNFHTHPLKPIKEKVTLAVEAYRLIVPLLKDTKTYSISRLSNQLNQILNLIIQMIQDNDSAIDQLELFLTEIDEHAAKTGKQHSAAHNLVERGMVYLENPSSKNYLKALDCFHKAKSLWYLDETTEGYTLALINIAQVYSGLGMNLAAKYYALCGVWAAIHFGNQATFKRISDSYAMVFYADFKQGAWISALDDYEEYIKARLEFKADELSMEDDSLFRNTLLDLTCILVATPKLHPALTSFIDFQKKSLGWLYTDYVQQLEEGLSNKLQDEQVLKDLLKGALTGIPLNDVGGERTILFKASGIEWNVIFNNTAILNAIGEEFCSLLQITLCEIGLLGTDLHLLQMPVIIHITQGEGHKSWIKQRPSHEESVWDVSIPFLDTKDQMEIQFHYAYIATNIKTLLSHLSVLPTKEFDAVFNELYKKQRLGEKGLAINTYQKVYFNLLTDEKFNQAMRSDFLPAPTGDTELSQSKFLQLFDGISDRYSKEASLKRIGERYENMHSKLAVSLAKWAVEDKFKELIHELRKAGWLDWQILMAIMNYVLSAKVEKFMSSVDENDPVKRKNIADHEFSRLFNLEEKDCYLDIPVSSLHTELFAFHLEKMPVDTLGSFGLENGMKHPNFVAVRHFLNSKFHFNNDDDSKNNPLKDI